MHGTRPWLIRSREANTSTPKVCGAGDTKLNEFVIGLLISADVIGLPHEAIPVPMLGSGAVSCLASDVRFGSKADIRERVRNVRFTPESGHYGAHRGSAGLTSGQAKFLITPLAIQEPMTS